jgi:hypothetical protein
MFWGTVMKKIVYQRPDGGTSIVIPTEKSVLEKVLGPLTDQEYEAHVRERSIPDDAINVVDIDDETIPTSREFRNAWTLSNSVISEDLKKSIDIKLAQIRVERNAKLAATDADYMKALEAGDSATLATLKVERQALRDVTNKLKDGSILSIEELRGKTLNDYLAKGQ